MNKILSVVGARPNFIKIAPVHKAFQQYPTLFEHKIIHTGQHFDHKMSKVFFDELQMPEPYLNLNIHGGSHAQQTARIMQAFEQVLIDEQPDMIIVPGDVNSTLACSLVASKMNIPVAHVESGLRSFDRTMPEEINRILTDQISELLFVSEPSGITHLLNEGIAKEKIHYVGNVMIDSLVHSMPIIKKSIILEKLGLQPGEYILATFHRPSNVDKEEKLRELVTFLNELSKKQKVVFPIHPRTQNNLTNNNLLHLLDDNIQLTEPLAYTDFLQLINNSIMVVTDSGGIQEETTFLGIICCTLRANTERPVTIDVGTNYLLGDNFRKASSKVIELLEEERKTAAIPEYWDGHTADRIVKVIKAYFDGTKK